MNSLNDYRTFKAAQVEEAVKILKSLNQALNQIPNTKVDVAEIVMIEEDPK